MTGDTMIDLQTHKNIFEIQTEQEFNDISLQIFRYQYDHNTIYHSFVNHLGIDIKEIQHFREIPFLPIEFFKRFRIYSSNSNPQAEFRSSGTTGSTTSKHCIADLRIYEKSFRNCFESFYGNPLNIRILALLPSYLEQGNSSLVYMVDKLIKQSQHPESGFYLDDWGKLANLINDSKSQTILIGVTYALLDLVEKHEFRNPNLIVMETGGMKGRRKEMIREDLHPILKERFHVPSIHSEYGMTELLSQAFSKGEGKFNSPPWMKIMICDMNDPLSLLGNNKTGGINVIDLANVYSCSFIATQDLGRIHNDHSFEVLGRFDTSDIRGCNLMLG
jgi:phenylacetate-coenzyme A ligase PaaK-like adenylate-forming protein